MPHPHRVRLESRGLAVATGSGAAGVFSALRARAGGVDLVWGLGDKRLEPWVEAELGEHKASGALTSVELVRSPMRVTGALSRGPGLDDRLRGCFDGGRWVYVSGNAAAGAAAHEMLTEALGERALHEASESLRYINSS